MDIVSFENTKDNIKLPLRGKPMKNNYGFQRKRIYDGICKIMSYIYIHIYTKGADFSNFDLCEKIKKLELGKGTEDFINLNLELIIGAYPKEYRDIYIDFEIIKNIRKSHEISDEDILELIIIKKFFEIIKNENSDSISHVSKHIIDFAHNFCSNDTIALIKYEIEKNIIL